MYSMVSDEEEGGEKRTACKCARHTGLCCGVTVILLLLGGGVILLLISNTSIAHSYFRREVWRAFSINRTLPVSNHTSDDTWEDLTQPYIFGLPASSKNLRLPLGPPPSPSLGSWYMEPAQDSDLPIVLYLHGIAQTRGYPHRVGLYQVLLEAGYPVLAVDYRGFADSSQIDDIREQTVVEDATAAFSYVREILAPGRKVIVWGHSQGAAILAHMMAERTQEELNGVTAVMENPFNNMDGQVSTLPWYMETLIKLVGLEEEDTDLAFKSTHWLPLVKCPVLILSAEDDPKIPVSLSEDLYKKTLSQGKTDVSRIVFGSDFMFGHNDIFKFECLTGVISQLWKGLLDTEGTTRLYTRRDLDTCNIL